MNVYPCCYQGISGFGCKDFRQRWMFIPDMGQLSNKIYRNLELNQLVFKNERAQAFEYSLENDKSSILQAILRVIGFPGATGNSVTIEGQLLATAY